MSADRVALSGRIRAELDDLARVDAILRLSGAA